MDLALAVAVLGLVLAGGLRLAPAWIDAGRQRETDTRVGRVEAALVGAMRRLHALPCPAPAAGARDGQAGPCPLVSSDDTFFMGAVPWQPLGLMPRDGEDGWGHRLIYAVAAPAVAGAWGCAAGTGSEAGGSAARGIPILGSDKTREPAQGAVFVLISTGPTAAGSLGRDGHRLPGTDTLGPSARANRPPDTPATVRDAHAGEALHAAPAPDERGADRFADRLHPLPLALLHATLECAEP
ncbi:hypothetical protein ROR02_16880 [Pararhodospirillum oryzae]|uniref:Uncharacterized protein n=1 Tax=Pararhodospirillum oryzae TaxID=478448 RepID=A0A512H7X1_9PROT|nr:hypothetical protein ROR02_16880 [Pararhodospirillum oryzae]